MNRSHRKVGAGASLGIPSDPFAGVSGQPLSDAGCARRDEIVADLLARSPGIRRRRVARRCALGASPIVVVLLAAFGVRSLWPPATHPFASTGQIAHAPPVEPAEPESPGVINPPAPMPHLIQIVSTAGRSYADRIVTSGSASASQGSVVVRTIDDETLMHLLALAGHSDGIVRVGDRTMLASDLTAPNPGMPAGGSPPGLPIPSDPSLRGL